MKKKRMKVLKIQTKNLLNMKMTVNYLNFVFRIEVKTKSKYRILNFVFQFIKNTQWHFGYTDSNNVFAITVKITFVMPFHGFIVYFKRRDLKRFVRLEIFTSVKYHHLNIYIYIYIYIYKF